MTHSIPLSEIAIEKKKWWSSRPAPTFPALKDENKPDTSR